MHVEGVERSSKWSYTSLLINSIESSKEIERHQKLPSQFHGRNSRSITKVTSVPKVTCTILLIYTLQEVREIDIFESQMLKKTFWIYSTVEQQFKSSNFFNTSTLINLFEQHSIFLLQVYLGCCIGTVQTRTYKANHPSIAL